MAETTVAIAVAVVVTIGLLLAGDSSARELRPSDHGLVFQTLSPAGARSSPEMRSFFNSDSQNSSTTSTTSSDMPLPRAMNSAAAPPSWLPDAVGGPNGGDQTGKALMAASLVCGIAGAVLLVASGLLYLLKYRTKQKRNAAFRGGDDGNHGENNDDEDNNKLQLVVRDP